LACIEDLQAVLLLNQKWLLENLKTEVQNPKKAANHVIHHVAMVTVIMINQFFQIC